MSALSDLKVPVPAHAPGCKQRILSRLEFASGICFHGLGRFFNRGVSIRNSPGAGGFIDTADSASLGRIDPAAMGFEATVSADGAKDRGCGNWNCFNLFDDGVEHGGEVLPALLHEARGSGVTVEKRTMAEAEFLHDGLDSFPKQEAGLDGFTMFVIANPTLTLVAKQGGWGGFVAAPSADDGGEVHVRSPWALKKGPTHVNLVVIVCQL